MLGLGLGIPERASLGAWPPPPTGYAFLLGKNPDGSYVILSGLRADASRAQLVGKVS